MATPTLETDRLILRPVELADAPAIQKHFAHWNIIRHLSPCVPWPYPADGAVEFLRDVRLPSMEAGDVLAWAITVRENGPALIGMIDFVFKTDPNLGNRGFWLAQDFWGCGYMTEAVEAVQDYVLLDLKIDKIMAVNSVDNRASARVKQKTGARRLRVVDGEGHEGKTQSEVWEITRESWAKQREQGAQS